MIPREAFAALTILSVAAWAFGVACDRLLVGWLHDHDQEPDRHNCNNCKYKNLTWYDEPCDGCTGDRWELEK